MLNKKHNQINLIVAWSIWLLTIIVYLLTTSRTVNFWDCGELIASAYKLQIPHPPGSPFYILMGRIFTLFAGSSESIAFSVNLLSVFSASFSVLFLYLSISHLATRILKKTSHSLSVSDSIIIMFASATGSLALAFSKSFWESATEAEVYSLSVLFSSIVFWLMLKWSKNKSDRYIILICLLIGISTGIHQLNILIIPALVFIYFFAKYQYSHKKLAITSVLAIALLLVVLSSITIIPKLAAQFELLFVNVLEMPFNSGLYFFAIFMMAILFGLIIYSHKKKLQVLNLITICTFVFLSGYSVYATVLIRASSNPPINENNPDNIFALISYLEREQYQKAPLIYGHSFNSTLDRGRPYIKGKKQYRRLGNRYELVNHSPKENYRKTDKGLFPRMWSREPAHILAYKEWANVSENKTPGILDNLKFLSRYQLGHMYFRYLFQNFSGIQNDMHGHGGPLRGNWITGIDFIDKFKIGHGKKDLIEQSSNGRRAFYFIPILFALAGIFFQYKKDKKSLTVVAILFVFTGIAIVFYLNQHPYQARERDYSYLASFYAFCIWIGLGTVALYYFLKKHINKSYLLYILGLACIVVVPLQMLAKNYHFADRSSNNFALNFAYNYLMSCEQDAILFTSGDNETFPLWYLQEVRGVRTDIKIVNLAFLNFDWYINQVKNKTYDAAGAPISVSQRKYLPGQRDFLVYKQNVFAFVEEIYLSNHKEITKDYHAILNTFLTMLAESGFKEKYPDDFHSLGFHYKNIRPHGADEDFRYFGKVINELQEEEHRNKLMLSSEQADELQIMLERFLAKQLQYHVPLNAVLRFIFSDDESTRIQSRIYEHPIDYLPVQKLRLDIDIERFKEKNPQVLHLSNAITEKMEWEINRENITKSDLMVLEIIRSNNWERPVYFSSTMPDQNLLGMNKYLYLEGWAYRLLPIDLTTNKNFKTNVNSKAMYDNVKDNFYHSHLNKDYYYNENHRNLLSRERLYLARLSESLYSDEKISESLEIANFCVDSFPSKIIPLDYLMIKVVKSYYKLGRKSAAFETANKIILNSEEKLDLYFLLMDKYYSHVNPLIQRELSTIRDLRTIAAENRDIQLQGAAKKSFDKYYSVYQKQKK